MKKLPLMAVLVCWVGYSYSSYNYGSTNNAIPNTGLTWDMNDVLPNEHNLSVNGVFYTYKPIKNEQDQMLVHVQNKNPNGGYTFRNTDNWTGKLGGIPIVKTIALEYMPKEVWGDGSIEVEGVGSVTDARVVYSYRYEDGCKNPLDNPTCPGYTDAVKDLIQEPPTTTIYNALEDDSISQEKSEVDYEEEEQEQEDVKEDSDLERAMAISEEALELGNNVIQNQLLKVMNNSVQMNNYYMKALDGGIYRETVVLKDSKLPDNKYQAILNLSEDIKHNKMVNLQYGEQ